MEEHTALEAQLSTCEDCRKFATSSTLERWNFQKPCIKYRTHTDWKPEHVKVVFIAEAPPGTSEGYFYDPKPIEGYAEVLRNHLLDLLGINHDDIAQALKEFEKSDYFLTDAIKCRCDKGQRSHPPPILAENCGRNWLGRELTILGPERICALGKTALEALGVVHGYEKAASAKAGRDCGTILDAKRPVLVWVFPSDRTSNYTKGKEKVFSKFTGIRNQK